MKPKEKKSGEINKEVTKVGEIPQEAEWEVAFEHRYYDILKAWEARFVFDLRKDLKSFIRQLLIDDRSKGKV